MKRRLTRTRTVAFLLALLVVPAGTTFAQSESEVDLRSISQRITQAEKNRWIGIGLALGSVLPAVLGFGNLYMSVAEPDRAGPVGATVFLIGLTAALAGGGLYMFATSNRTRDELLALRDDIVRQAGDLPVDSPQVGSDTHRTPADDESSTGPSSLESVAASAVADVDALIEGDGAERLMVLGIVDSDGRPTVFGDALADQIAVAVVRESARLSLVEREALDAAVRETEFESFLLSNDPAQYGNLAEFAPADLILVGRHETRSSPETVTIRVFRTSDGIVVYANSYTIAE